MSWVCKRRRRQFEWPTAKGFSHSHWLTAHTKAKMGFHTMGCFYDRGERGWALCVGRSIQRDLVRCCVCVFILVPGTSLISRANPTFLSSSRSHLLLLDELVFVRVSDLDTITSSCTHLRVRKACKRQHSSSTMAF